MEMCTPANEGDVLESEGIGGGVGGGRMGVGGGRRGGGGWLLCILSLWRLHMRSFGCDDSEPTLHLQQRGQQRSER